MTNNILKKSGKGKLHSSAQKYLVGFAFFLMACNDTIILAVINPIVPRLVLDINEHPGRMFSSHFIDQLGNLTPAANQTGDELIEKYGFQVSFLSGLKQGVESASTLTFGFLLVRFGPRYYKHFLMLGISLCLLSTCTFAYARNYAIMAITRIPQGAGNALMIVTGMALLAATVTDAGEQAKYMSKAFTGFAVGEAVGYAVGGPLFQYAGVQAPFFLVIAVNMLIFSLLLCIRSPTEITQTQPSFRESLRLLKDRKILAGLGLTLVQYINFGLFFGVIPSWLVFNLKAEQWVLGVVLAVGMAAQIVAEFSSSNVAFKIGHWKCVLIAYFLLSAGMMSYTFCNSPWIVMLPMAVERIGFGLSEGTLAPVLNHIVCDIDPNLAGAINGLFNTAFNIGVTLGSLLGGGFLKFVSFQWLYRASAIAILSFSPLTLVWRNISLHRTYDSTNTEDTESSPLICENSDCTPAH